MIPNDLPIGTLVRYNPSKFITITLAAKAGATAIVSGRYFPFHPSHPMIEVKWVRDGLDCGQNDGGYFCENFELVCTSTQKTNQPCDCSSQQLTAGGCRFLKTPDSNGLFHC